MTDTSVRTGITVTATHSILFMIYSILYKPFVKVDGNATKIGWKEPAFIPTSAGSHQVEVFYKLWWFLPAGKASTTVNVADGGSTALAYQPPLWFPLSTGKLTTA